MPDIDALNAEFGLNGALEFREGPGGFIFAAISNEAASAEIHLHGAQVTSFIPTNHEPVIYLSPLSHFEPGKAIRGGVPISWPWFADHPSDNTKPAHGFARTSEWRVLSTSALSPEETEIVLTLPESENTRRLWPHEFDLSVSIRVGHTLHSELLMKNTGDEAFTVTSAFHSYYHVGGVNDVEIHGLEGRGYIDKVHNFETKRQAGAVGLSGETDRIYLETAADCIIEDPGLGRAIHVSKSGSNSTVIWNPWAVNAAQMADMPGSDYMKFVCVETANAGDDIITINPGSEHRLSMTVEVKRISG